jgi:hypothetical protein
MSMVTTVPVHCDVCGTRGRLVIAVQYVEESKAKCSHGLPTDHAHRCPSAGALQHEMKWPRSQGMLSGPLMKARCCALDPHRRRS